MSTKSTESWSTATASAAWVPLFSIFHSTLFYLCRAVSPSPRSPFYSPLSLIFTDLRYFSLSFSLSMCVCLYRFIILERRTATMWWWWTSWDLLSKTYSTSALGSSHWKQVSDWLLSPPWYLGAEWGGDILSAALLCHAPPYSLMPTAVQCDASMLGVKACLCCTQSHTCLNLLVTHITVRTPLQFYK